MFFYFMKTFSIFGYSNPFSIKRLNDDIISQAESFVQKKLEEFLTEKCSRKKCILSDADKFHFFGGYSSCPSDFQFQADEMILIKKIVKHVLHQFDCEDISDALANFTLNESTNSPAANWFFDKVAEDVNDKMNVSLCEVQTNEEILDNQRKPKTQTHFFLNRLLATADQNACRSEGGYRYDDDIKNFAAYFRMLAGPLAYNTIQRNLVCALPSLSTTNRYIYSSNKTITEGVLRCEELLNYLKDRKLEMCVALSEDATRIEGKIQYDARTNQLVGFILPMDFKSGLPIPFAYKARSAEEVVEHFSNGTSIASYLITIMAKPIGSAPAFCLLIFGSDNRFSAQLVANRWKFITSQLMNLGIMVISIASDSDPRFNSAMRQNSALGCATDDFKTNKWFSCGDNMASPFYIQDTTHIGTKMRNFLLKTLMYPRKLPFGNYSFITIEHLQHLMNRFSKDKHQLTPTVLNPYDRQNFDSVLRICSPAVIALLNENVNGSNGTIMYLNIMKNFIDSFMDIHLTPLERVKRIWYSIFIVRIWRKYVISTKSLNLKNNFLTSYCYVCLELNAHSLVKILFYLKEINKPELFKPHLFDSQQCEMFYSQLRSFTTTFSTKANCTVKEIMSRINKIQLQNHISSGTVSEFVFPKKISSKYAQNITETTLPSKEEIVEAIKYSEVMAIDDAITIGLLSKRDAKLELKCEIDSYKPKIRKNSKKMSDETYRIRKIVNEKMIQLQSVSLINYADKFSSTTVPVSSSYVEIFGSNKRLIVKKTSLTWLLRAGSFKLSSDRLLRVRSLDDPIPKKQKKKVKHLTNHLSGGVMRINLFKRKK